jgi:hypothetical protein
MSVFIIISPIASNPKLEATIIEQYPEDFYKLSENQWLVCAGGIAKELSTKLKINDDEGTGPAIVFSIANYWGRANPNIWEWIKTKWEKSCG